MSYISTIIQSRPNIQAELVQLFGGENLGLKLDALPILEFINSPENTAGVTIKEGVSPGNSKLRTVEARYFQRLMEADVIANQTNPTCTAENKVGDLVTSYSLDPDENLQVAKKVVLRDLTTSFRDSPEYFNSLIFQMMDVLERKLADKTVTDLAALNGSWATPVTGVVNDQLVVKTLKDSSIDLYPYTMEDIDLAFMQSNMGNSAIFGGASLYKYYRRLQAGCCSDGGNNLRDLMSTYGKAVAYDQKYEAAYGVNQNIVIQTGALQMLYWTYAGWENGVNPIFNPSNTGGKTVVFGMRTGLPFDLTIAESDCGSTVNIILTATTKLVGKPNDMYQDSDIQDGNVGVMEILVSNVA